MSLTLRIVLIVVILIYIFVISKAVKRKTMRINYLIFWSITGIILIIALLVPDLVDMVTKIAGFELPINMIFSCAIFIILYLIFDLTKQITKEQKQNVALIQEVSILKKKVEELENKNREGK